MICRASGSACASMLYERFAIRFPIAHATLSVARKSIVLCKTFLHVNGDLVSDEGVGHHAKARLFGFSVGGRKLHYHFCSW